VNRQPWDNGLQIERTALAWLRTCMSLVVVALIAFRFAAPHSLAIALALMAGIVTLGTVAGILSWRRYRTTDEQLIEGKPLPGGTLAAVMAGMTVLTGVLGLVYALATA
jgi:uncharacterized membrane protein YidH (DUF202 family)